MLLTLVGGAGWWGIERLQALNQSFVEGPFEKTLTLSRLQMSLRDMGGFEKDMVIAYEKPEQVLKAKTAWLAARDEAQRQLDLMQAGEAGQDNALVLKMKEQLTQYVGAVEPVTRQLETSGYDSATVANRMLNRAHASYDELLQSLKQVEELLMAETASARQAGLDASRQTLVLFGMAVAIAALVVVPTTLANMTSICNPLDEARRLASAIAKGDLTRPVQATGRDETATLMRALGEMQTSLARIVGEVRNSTDSIGTASQEIASGNQDLSARTEQAASNLQETAASNTTATARNSTRSTAGIGSDSTDAMIDRPTAPAKAPSTRPPTIGLSPSRSTSCTIPRRLAPSADRTPNSRVRRDTSSETIPNRPVSASSRATPPIDVTVEATSPSASPLPPSSRDPVPISPRTRSGAARAIAARKAASAGPGSSSAALTVNTARETAC
jgi:HAMP domain-containing protein